MKKLIYIGLIGIILIVGTFYLYVNSESEDKCSKEKEIVSNKNKSDEKEEKTENINTTSEFSEMKQIVKELGTRIGRKKKKGSTEKIKFQEDKQITEIGFNEEENKDAVINSEEDTLENKSLETTQLNQELDDEVSLESEEQKSTVSQNSTEIVNTDETDQNPLEEDNDLADDEYESSSVHTNNDDIILNDNEDQNGVVNPRNVLRAGLLGTFLLLLCQITPVY